MARSRNIKPGFFKNETLAECSPLARLLFAGLWCLADRAGRLEDRPKRIRAEILPYDDGSVDEMLEELNRAGFILRYSIDGRRLIQIQSFAKHQNPHCKETESTIPAPEENDTSTVQVPDKNSIGPADSLNLIPNSLTLISEKPSCSSLMSDLDNDSFTEFWKNYPRKVGKGAAEKAWEKHKPDLPTVLPALKRDRSTEQWRKDNGRFIPHPATWLNQRRWEDEPDSGTASTAVVGQRPTAGDRRTRHGVEEVFTHGAGWIPA